uniref:Fanconi-associated nuclease n=1 Tax=Strongyloides stercoralis TaxID=6248 RepID=A0A0K0EDU9_STRER
MEDFSSVVIQLNKRLLEKQERLDCYHFLRILYNVIVKFDPETRNEFFTPFYLDITSIANLDNVSLAMLLTFYYKGFGTHDEMKNIMKIFLKKGLSFMVQNEDINLINVLEMLTVKELNILHKKFCKVKKKTTRDEIFNDIINSGKQRNLMGKNVGITIKNCAIEMLSALHYPDLMDIRNDYNFESDSIMGKNVLQYLSKASEMSNDFKDNSNVLIIKIYNNFDDIMDYVDSIEMLRRIQSTDNVMSETFINVIKYTREALINDSKKISKWLNKNLPIKLLQYTRISISCYIFYVAAEKFVKAREYKVAEKLYFYITEDKILIPFIGSKMYSKFWIRRCINIKNNGDLDFQKQFYKNLSNFSMYFLESTNIEIHERESKLTPDTNNSIYTYENEEIVLPILKKTGSSGVKNQFFITKNNHTFLVNVEKAVLEYFMSTNKYTHGGHYENQIWIEAFYLIFGDLVFNKIDIYTPYCHEFIKEHPLLGSKDYVAKNIVFLKNRYNTFVFGNVVDQREIVKKNMELYCEIKNIDRDCTIFENPQEFFKFIKCINIQNFILLCINQMSFKRGIFSGYPDLVLWNVKTHDIICLEVKGPGDILSCKQKLAFKILNTFLHVSCKCINVKAQPQNPPCPIIT